MILVCGEALIDVFVAAGDGPALPATLVAGGSPFNVALGLARLGQPVAYCGGLSADRFGTLLFLLFAGCLAFGRDRVLYSVMFVLALAMELYGTALGNWTWRAAVPGLGIGAANPPFAAGAFYALLDLLVLAAVSAFGRSVADPGVRPVEQSLAAQARSE